MDPQATPHEYVPLRPTSGFSITRLYDKSPRSHLWFSCLTYLNVRQTRGRPHDPHPLFRQSVGGHPSPRHTPTLQPSAICPFGNEITYPLFTTGRQAQKEKTHPTSNPFACLWNGDPRATHSSITAHTHSSGQRLGAISPHSPFELSGIYRATWD